MPPELVEPAALHHASFLAALAEYHEDGIDTYLPVSHLARPDDFGRYLAALRRAGEEGAPVTRDLAGAETVASEVPQRVRWWPAGRHYVGRVRIALGLNDELREYGGHIGFDIRPSERGRGHATALLAASLTAAEEWGLVEVLLTCAPDNHASRRVIERNGGVLPDVSPAGRLRYWCRTIADR